MKQYAITAKAYVIAHKIEFITGASIIAAIAIIAVSVTLFVRATTPNVVYQSAKACDLFSFAEAKELLGDQVLTTTTQGPVISRDTAVSKCGYTDGNPDMNNALVAAIVVRSGINDKGVAQNKSEFTAGKPSKNVETVKDLGDDAYFNQELGQLNVLYDKMWVILSYGPGAAPQSNSPDKAVTLAKKVLHN